MRHLALLLLFALIAAPALAGDRDHDHDHSRDHHRDDSWCYHYRRGYEGCPDEAYDERERPDRYDYGYRGDRDEDRGWDDDD